MSTTTQLTTVRPAALLVSVFDSVHSGAAEKHFTELVGAFQTRDWEKAILKGGKFVEAVCKCLALHVGLTLPSERDFKAGKILDDLVRQPSGTVSDNIRVTIPRSLRFVYDIASNRGARHDPGEIDSNEMDAAVVLANCSWALAEMVRCAQKGMPPEQALRTVASLMKRRVPVFEDIEGRTYVEIARSARELVLLLLWAHYPDRLSRWDLIEDAERHGYKRANVDEALKRLFSITDVDGRGGITLRAVGLDEAEQIVLSRSGTE